MVNMASKTPRASNIKLPPLLINLKPMVISTGDRNRRGSEMARNFSPLDMIGFDFKREAGIYFSY